MPEFYAGTEQATLNLAKSAQRDGHRVDVVTCSFRDPGLWLRTDQQGVRFTSIEGIPVYGLPGQEMGTLAQLGINRDKEMAATFGFFLDGREKYDLVHVMHPMRMVDAIETVHAREIPYIVTLTDFFFLCYRINLIRHSGQACPGPAAGEACKVHCPLDAQNPEILNARHARMSTLLDNASDVVACSNFVADRFRNEFVRLRIRVIEHGVDLLRFGRPPLRDGRDTTVFGFLGTLSEIKGVPMLADAFSRLPMANAGLDLIGPANRDDEAYHRLEVLAERDNRIKIKSPITANQVPETLKEFDILCLPSLVPETYSLVLHEGFASGLPCLVSNLGFPPEVVRSNNCGEVLPAGEVGAWTDAMARIALDPSVLVEWRRHLPLPTRIEEEGFLYSCLYRAAARASQED